MRAFGIKIRDKIPKHWDDEIIDKFEQLRRINAIESTFPEIYIQIMDPFPLYFSEKELAFYIGDERIATGEMRQVPGNPHELMQIYSITYEFNPNCLKIKYRPLSESEYYPTP